jgi:UrcA family protein
MRETEATFMPLPLFLILSPSYGRTLFLQRRWCQFLGGTGAGSLAGLDRFGCAGAHEVCVEHGGDLVEHLRDRPVGPIAISGAPFRLDQSQLLPSRDRSVDVRRIGRRRRFVDVGQGVDRAEEVISASAQPADVPRMERVVATSPTVHASRSLHRNFTQCSRTLHACGRDVRETTPIERRLVLPGTADKQLINRLEIHDMTNRKTALSLRRILAPALLLAIATAAMPAGADVPDAPLSVKVSYADLDVAHAAGAKALYGRIQNAARDVCKPLSNQPRLHTSAWDKCISNAVSNAVQSIGQPALTSLHEEKTRNVLPVRFASLKAQ